jgi:hypothetical protein
MDTLHIVFQGLLLSLPILASTEVRLLGTEIIHVLASLLHPRFFSESHV